MSYPINYPTPQGANIQIFNVGGATSEWVKPQGASFVWFTLIGGGGAGGNGSTSGIGDGAGGGSGAVTNCMVPAFLIPDVLQISVGRGGLTTNADGTATVINYVSKATYELLRAEFGGGGTAASGNTNGSPGGAGGAATPSNYFSCMGFYQSIAGQTGDVGANDTISATTFLCGGTATDTKTSNYGYSVKNQAGYFQMQPIIVGVGGGRPAFSEVGTASPSRTSQAHIGCGGGGGLGNASGSSTRGARGGNGMVVIITW
jgi:hypothetical protein